MSVVACFGIASAVRPASSNAQALASSNLPSWVQGVRTCRPVLPEVFTKDSTPSSPSVALIAFATAMTSPNGALPGSRSKSTKSGQSRSFTRDAQTWNVSVPWFTR